MKILVHDPKTAFFKLRMESRSDLWRLSRLVLPGDILGAFTHRRDPEVPPDTPAGQRERRAVFLTVRVEQIEFHEFSGHLRFTGLIVEGPFDIGRHHTLDVEEDSKLSLTKANLTSADWVLINEGKKAKDEPTMVIACLDGSEGVIVRLHGRSMETVVETTLRGVGKYAPRGQSRRDKEEEEYLANLLGILGRESQKAKRVIIAGPGFCKERLFKGFASTHAGPAPILASASEAGLPGVHELLRSGRVESLLKGSLLAEELAEVERLVQTLGKEGMTAVGPKETLKASEMGAVAKILVLDTRLHEKETTEVIDRAREGGAEVLLVRHEGEAGRRLTALGGVAAILRYRLSLA